MQTRQLGTSDLHITPIGVGAWAIGGGDWAFGWGPQDDAESIAAIHCALDHGINWIDTAAVYGLDGVRIVLWTPTKGPTTATHRPGTDAERSELKIAISKCSFLHLSIVSAALNPYFCAVNTRDG